MINVGDINEYLVSQAPVSVSVNDLLKCLRDKTGCNCLKTAHYPSWSGGNQKIVVCTQCENFKLRVIKRKGRKTQYWQVVEDKSYTEDKTPVTCLATNGSKLVLCVFMPFCWKKKCQRCKNVNSTHIRPPS